MSWIKKLRYNLALQKVAQLEKEQDFITPFFCGETMYPIAKKKNEEQLKKAKAKLRILK